MKLLALLSAALLSLAACTYKLEVEHAAENLNMGVTYAPCGAPSDAGDASDGD